MAKTIHAFGLHIIIVITWCFNAWNTSYKKLGIKISWFILSCVSIGGITIYSISQFIMANKLTLESIVMKYDGNKASCLYRIIGDAAYIQHILIPIVLIISGYIIGFKLRTWHYKTSEKITTDSIYKLFKYPNNTTGLFLSIFWKYPVTTISYYYKGFKYGFDKKTGNFEKYAMTRDELNSGKYYIKNTYDYEFEKLDALIGTKWKWNKNCLNILNI